MGLVSVGVEGVSDFPFPSSPHVFMHTSL